MFKGINEIIEYVELDGDKSFRLLSFLTTAGLAYILYERAGGAIVTTIALDTNFWIYFFVSFQVFIPIILFFVAWYVSRFISGLISFLCRLVFEYIYFRFFTKNEGKSVEGIKQLGSKQILEIITSLLNRFGFSFNIHKLSKITEDELIEGTYKLLEEIENSIEDKFIRFWVVFQLFFIYLVKFENYVIFAGNLNRVVIIMLSLILFFDVLNIVALASLKKIFALYIKALEAESVSTRTIKND
jgi:hypothetical protein